ncbi:MAG TPA: IS481 family transposase [Pirellulales bacterium]|nr:IS481 family transposase [Pirellulales bacterium]
MSCEFDRVEGTEGTEREAQLNGAEAQQEAREQGGASEEHDGASNAVCSEADGAESLPPDAQEETMDAAEPAGGDSSRPAGWPADVRRTMGASIDLPSGVELARKPLGWDGRRGRKLVKPDEIRLAFSPHERLLILDTWQRSGLPAGDFAPLVGLSKHTLYLWKKRFAQQGPAGLMEQPRGASTGSRLSEVAKRTIVMLKELHPDWGCQRISDELLRGPALAASSAAVARVLHEAGYEMEERLTRPHPDKQRSFERAKPNQLWQTDLFTFVLKRQNRRLYLVAFMDDHSRFLVSYGLHASASSALVLEVLRAAIASYGPPEEILTDNGPQYVTWRGKSQFSRELEQQGIRQVVSRPKHPQTLGKVERFWGTLWRECLQRAVFLDLEDARRRIGLFIDHYNFQRPHQGLDGLTPADRFFNAAPTVLATLRERVASNALELARQGVPRPPFYMTGQVAGQPFSVHAEGERVFLTRPGQPRQEVELVGPPEAESAAADDAAPLPEALCPHAAPESGDDLPEPHAPGASWYETPAEGASQPDSEGGAP